MSITFEHIDDTLQVYLDGNLLTSISKDETSEYSYIWEPRDKGYVINKLSDITVDSFPDNFMISDFYKSQSFKYLEMVVLNKKNNHIEVEYSLIFNYKDWSELVPPAYISQHYESKLTGFFESVCLIDDDGYGLIFEVKDVIENGNIIDEIERFANAAKLKLIELEKELLMNVKSDLIVKIFKFPIGYEVICSQYVLWFGELLKQIGINADVSTENKEGYTFLTITKNDESAFKENIEKALYLYLSLPYSEHIPVSQTKNDIESKIFIQSLQQQVIFFTQQCDMKSSIIELQNISNGKLKEQLQSANAKISLLESLQNDRLDLLDGAISLVEYKIGPLVFNPKRILKKIINEK
ncbi:hypothetical protein BJP22_12245 [Aeromonas veronii]|uniref:hypothetical protein n=1 Tax=Aeromonas veronii TaxID=654 RepID=UPI0005AA67A0|nr:hypothetical protein [Aeromonas veronii]OKP40171.1 hypothetical protein BJP22_12245 [Aeromonas veronii]